MGQGMLTQTAKIVGSLAPIDTGGVARLGCHVNFSKYNRVAFIIYVGAIGNNCVLTMLAGTDALGTGGVAMGFTYRLSTGGAALIVELSTALVTVGVGGYTWLAATDDNEIMVVEMTAAELVAPTTNYYVGPNMANAAACLVSAVAICMEPRYQADAQIMPSAVVA